MSEVNLDIILGAEKMAGGGNDSADWSPPPAKTKLIGHQHLRLEGSQLLPGERNHGINLTFSCHILFFYNRSDYDLTRLHISYRNSLFKPTFICERSAISQK
jgi:hypothetical protein